MRRICIIPCGKRKIWKDQPDHGPAKAHYAYTGIFHKLCQQYARQFYEEWIILSAKHGFLKPEDIVPGDYDLGFHMDDQDIITLLELKKQAARLRLEEADKVIMLGGKKYEPILRSLLDNEIHFPLAGSKGIGDMQSKLKSSIVTNAELGEGFKDH
ncbi:DUF6884 domain-containing protein [Metabacillus sp. 113a]|uniref:DUF6884 domain-containing protein n=1 Tax=Metabacillus sp. 113a TaxID=3404706 RepID=UPI003CEDE94F